MTNFKYDAILYDLDGTLIDSVPVILQSFRQAYIEKFGECTRTDEDFKSFIGKPLKTTFEMHGDDLAEELVKIYLDINCKMLAEDKVDLFPTVMEGLLKLKELGVKQGIVTSKKRASAMITVKLKGFEEIFDDFVFFEDSPKHKPDAAPILTACERFGIKDPSRVLYVGDALPDALCAKNAGCDFALVDWSTMDREEILNSVKTIIIKSLCELSCII